MAYVKKASKSLACKECSEIVENVGNETISVTCWKCVSAQLTGRPVGMDLEEWGRLLKELEESPDCQDSEE
jgi:cytochrome c5